MSILKASYEHDPFYVHGAAVLSIGHCEVARIPIADAVENRHHVPGIAEQEAADEAAAQWLVARLRTHEETP